MKEEGDLLFVAALIAQRVSRSARYNALLPLGAYCCLLLLLLLLLPLLLAATGCCWPLQVGRSCYFARLLFRLQVLPLVQVFFSSPNIRIKDLSVFSYSIIYACRTVFNHEYFSDGKSLTNKNLMRRHPNSSFPSFTPANFFTAVEVLGISI